MPESQPPTTSARVVADSIDAVGNRITSMELVFPRFILAEFNTHRMFSRNSASSRAIPPAKLIAMVREHPVIPAFGKNRPGMSADESISPERARIAARLWLDAAKNAAGAAEALARLGVHKQAVNRLLEPFLWHTVLVTSTTYENFFALRCAPDAQPEMQTLANAMRDAFDLSVPVPMQDGEWHIPYGDGGQEEDDRIRAIARCARLSTVRHQETRPIEEDRTFVERLAQSGHWSPFEHIAQASPGTHANYSGWASERALRQEMVLEQEPQGMSLS